MDAFERRLGELEDDIVTLRVRLALFTGGLAVLSVAGNLFLALYLGGHLR